MTTHALLGKAPVTAANDPSHHPAASPASPAPMGTHAQAQDYSALGHKKEMLQGFVSWSEICAKLMGLHLLVSPAGVFPL